VSRALFDVNVLVALFDQDHIDHLRAREWLSREIASGWASCAITQNGFVRIVSQPGYPSPITPHEAISRLERATSTEHHEFWPCSVSILDARTIDRSRILGPRQVTDVYLLATAVANGGRFVTFDRTVPLAAVSSATADQLVVV
jgi:toxin-antitoxin system PIN domain toxin